MAIWMQVKSGEHVVTISVGGGYNPDILDDTKARLVTMFRETVEIVTCSDGEGVGTSGDDEPT